MTVPGTPEMASEVAAKPSSEVTAVPPDLCMDDLSGSRLKGISSSSDPQLKSSPKGVPLSFETLCVAPQGIPEVFREDGPALDEPWKRGKGGKIPPDPLTCDWSDVEGWEDARVDPGARGLKLGFEVLAESRKELVLLAPLLLYLL